MSASTLSIPDNAGDRKSPAITCYAATAWRLELLSLGYRPIPLAANAKVPPKGFPLAAFLSSKTEITPETIEAWAQRWPDATNTGILCGGDLLVIDADSEAAVALLDACGLPVTPIVETARGRHVYVRRPPWMTASLTGGSAIIPGLDIKATGYVVAPGSRHPSGAEYRALVPLDTPLADLPAWLADRLRGDGTPAAAPREQEALAALRAHRAASDLPTSIAAESLAQNDRLRALDAQQKAATAAQHAFDEGLRVYRDRRSKLSPAALPAASASSIDQATRRIASLADQLAESTAHVRAKPSDFALGLSTYSGMGPAMIRRKKAHVQRLYDILQRRARSQNGNAIFFATEACDYTESLGLGRSKAARAIKDGVGLTWERIYVRDSSGRRRRAYRLRSKEAICATLGLSWPGPRVDLPDEAYTGSLTDYCAHVYSAFWHGQEDRSYTRSTLQRLFGVTHNTLIAWEARAGILVRPRYQEADVPKNDFQAQELAKHRSRRFWLTVRQGERAICSAGLLDANNDLRENYQVHADYVRQEATRKPGRTLKHAWQEANTYEPTRTRLSASGRSRHITRNLTTPDHEHKGRFSGAQGGSSTAEPPRHFHTQADADDWQARPKNRDKCAAVQIGQRAPVTRPPRVKRYPTAIYAFRYSLAASFELPAKPEAQQMRLLQRGW